MKIVFGFTDIRPDGMGSAATTLMRALKAQGVDVQPVHIWKHIEVPGYEEEFNPIFVSDDSEEPELKSVISRMVEVVNGIPGISYFSEFGAPLWKAIIPYLREDIRVVESIHNTNPSAIKQALAYHERISAYVGVSEGVSQKFKKILPKKEWYKVNTIANAVRIPLCPKENYEIAKGELHVAYVGRIENQGKGCGKIPLIFAELKKRGVCAKIDMYGYFHNYEQEFKSLCRKYEVEDMVRYQRMLRMDEVYATISSYDMLLMPSNFEGFGLSLVEAMAMGLPCVVSSLHNVTDWIVHDRKDGILVPKDDIRGFADAVEEIGQMSVQSRETLGANARLRAIELSSPEAHGKAYRILLENTISHIEYQIPEAVELSRFEGLPAILQSWWLARILPPNVKSFLRRFMR